MMITHDIDEALFLADRVVMMTNGPPPRLAKSWTAFPPSARSHRTQFIKDPHYYILRNHALAFLFSSAASDH
jgi:ABC-type nitrate/sulfonate/bicarbonate transport system ATPase subunit